jgi:transcription initiation factor TFIIIB Brf1 subunit/transcription initiation factor TFIIB
MESLQAISSRQNTIQVNPLSYLHHISTLPVLDRWIADMWTYCHETNTPDQVGYNAMHIYTTFLNTRSAQYNKSVWVNHACIWIACKLFFDDREDASAYEIVRKARVKRGKRVYYVKKLVKTEAKIAAAVGFSFSKPLAIDFVIVITKMLDIQPGTDKYRDITACLKKNTCASSVSLRPIDMAVRAIVTCDPSLEKRIDELVLEIK